MRFTNGCDIKTIWQITWTHFLQNSADLVQRSKNRQDDTCVRAHTHAHTQPSLHNPSDTVDMQSDCVSKHDWHSAVGGHGGQRSAESFFPAIIKQFNWICSYAEEFLVWISISMPSHKSYFQVQWALSSAKLILHDIPRGPRCRFVIAEGTMADTSMQVNVKCFDNLFEKIIITVFWDQSYLSPVFKEVFPEHFLSGVFMVQHLGKKQRHFFSSRCQLHLLTCTHRKTQEPPPHLRPSIAEKLGHYKVQIHNTIDENPFCLSKFKCAQCKFWPLFWIRDQ